MSYIKFNIVKKEDLKSLQIALTSCKAEIEMASGFVKCIRDGKPNEMPEIQNSDLLISLVALQEKLHRMEEEQRLHSWINKGLSMFVGILQSENSDLKTLCDRLIRSLVKYVGAIQGILYVFNEETKTLDLISGSGNSHDHQEGLTIESGEGLVGVVFSKAEKKILTAIPDSYMPLGSGLGEAKPKSILIIPLKANQLVYGVLELASFDVMADYKIEFIERLAESIASAIHIVKANEKTLSLLNESRQKEEKLRLQEEELKRNLNELNTMRMQEAEMMKNMEDMVMQMQEEALRQEHEHMARIQELESRLSNLPHLH